MIISVVMAKKEYEAWFIAAGESLRGKRGLIYPIYTPQLTQKASVAPKNGSVVTCQAANLTPRQQDQPALTAVFDVNIARRAESFDKCYREVALIVRRLIDASML